MRKLAKFEKEEEDGDVEKFKDWWVFNDEEGYFCMGIRH